MINYQGRWALITGASAGIGDAFAHELAKKGVNLILVARREDRLSTLANHLRTTYAIQVDIVPLDLSQADAAYQLFKTTETLKRRVHILINNAGIGVYGMLHETDIKKNEQLIYLNVLSLALITQLYLPNMLQDNEGMILNIASTAAFQPLPYMSNYGASKAFVLSFTEALWAEYQHTALRILAVCPGPVETEFFTAMGNKMASLGKRDTSEAIAKSSLAAAEKNNTYFVPGRFTNYLLVILSRLSPRKLSAKASAYVMKKNQA